MIHLTIALLFGLTRAFTSWQSLAVRESIKKYGPPDAVFIDVAMVANFAHTDMAQKIVSIDAQRFECCPNSFRSVVRHELDHCRGRMHNTVFGDPMSYHLTIDAVGDIIEDPKAP